VRLQIAGRQKNVGRMNSSNRSSSLNDGAGGPSIRRGSKEDMMLNGSMRGSSIKRRSKNAQADLIMDDVMNGSSRSEIDSSVSGSM